MTKRKIALDVINPHAAGIDVGSRSHYVAIGQTDEDVKEFGVYNEDLLALSKWLLDNKVKTVAMESTGTYWQSLFVTLQGAGLEVILCNGKFTKNIKGKKTDVQDCQWIQKLHTLGLLSGSFLPDEATEQLRTYCRHRTNLLEVAASTSQKMQKYLRLLNLRLDVVVNDITGLTGLSIIKSVCKGESNADQLASLRGSIPEYVDGTVRLFDNIAQSINTHSGGMLQVDLRDRLHDWLTTQSGIIVDGLPSALSSSASPDECHGT